MKDIEIKQDISVREAQAIILDRVRPGGTERVMLAQSCGRTLAEPAVSDDRIPPFDNSAMDGFAVRTDDLVGPPTELRVIEDIPAGSVGEKPITPGTCARIMTGAPFPAGADAVAPVEWTEPVGATRDRVRILRAPHPGQHVRPAGEDVRPGDVLFEVGHVIAPPTVGMLAALGYADVLVRRPPTVAVIATGDELVDIDEVPGPGRIRNSNGPALAAQAVSAGAQVLSPLVARDDPADIRSCIESIGEADVLLFSGGVSVGDYDYVKAVLDEMGMQLMFWRVRQRPGKPLAFGMLDDRLVFGLPGNPVSSAVCFEMYVRPALAAMLGRAARFRPLHPAVLDEPVRKRAGLHYFIRGRTSFGEEGRLHVRTTGAQGSNLYASFARADCLVHLPEHLEDPGPGLEVQIEWLMW